MGRALRRRRGRRARADDWDRRAGPPGRPAAAERTREPARIARPRAGRRCLRPGPSHPGLAGRWTPTRCASRPGRCRSRPPAPGAAGPGASGPRRLSRITTLQPSSYNEARTIGERYRDGQPVIMNLTELDDAAAKRLVDFAAGLAFALRGSIDKVTSRVFLLTPADVEVSADDARKLAERTVAAVPGRRRLGASRRPGWRNAESSARIEVCPSPSSSSSTTPCSSSGCCSSAGSWRSSCAVSPASGCQPDRAPWPLR